MEVVSEQFFELGIVVLVLFPDVAEDDAYSSEVEGRDNDVKGDEWLLRHGVGAALSDELGFGVLLDFGALDWQFVEVVVPAHVGGVLHEEDQEVGLDVNQQLCGELEPDGL